MDAAFIEERCFFLNMFFKQLVRCPYLLESDELKLFIRPITNVDKNLTLLPKLTNQKLLEKVLPFYSILGELQDEHVRNINLYINNFADQCKRNLNFMEKFLLRV